MKNKYLWFVAVAALFGNLGLACSSGWLDGLLGKEIDALKTRVQRLELRAEQP